MLESDKAGLARPGHHRREARRKQNSVRVSLYSHGQDVLEVLNLGAPSPPTSGGALLPSQKPHAGRLAHVYGQLSNGAYLVNACAAIESAPKVTLELWVDLDLVLTAKRPSALASVLLD